MSTATDEARAKTARDAIFSCHQEVKNRCAQYTANMAYYFMNGQFKPTFTGNGDMGTQAYYDTIQNMGYKLSINQTSLSKETLKTSIYNSTFPPGSVVCYQGEEGNHEESYYKYGHTQFYVGGDRHLGSSFPSSKKANYGSAFVYDGRPCDKWTYKVFTPSGSTSSNFYFCEQEYVPTTTSPSLPSQPANNNGKPGSGLAFYEPYNVSISESERNANGRYIVEQLQSRVHLTLDEACAAAGCFGLESGWNPTAYSKHQTQHDFGIAQWTVPYGRQQYLFEKICNSDKTAFRSLQKQVDFIVFELQNRYLSPTNGGSFNYSNIPGLMRKLTNKSAGLVELTWLFVCYYEAGLSWRDKPYSQKYWDNNNNHIKQRFEWAQKAKNLF